MKEAPLMADGNGSPDTSESGSQPSNPSSPESPWLGGKHPDNPSSQEEAAQRYHEEQQKQRILNYLQGQATPAVEVNEAGPRPASPVNNQPENRMDRIERSLEGLVDVVKSTQESRSQAILDQFLASNQTAQDIFNPDLPPEEIQPRANERVASQQRDAASDDSDGGEIKPAEGMEELKVPGIRLNTEVPATPEGKMKMLTDLLERVEKSRRDVELDQLKDAVATIKLIINGLGSNEYLRTQSPDSNNRGISERMNEEFMNRIQFHQEYLQILDAGGIDELKKAYGSISFTVINGVVRKKEIVACSNFYEQLGEKFASDPEKFRNELYASFILANQIEPDGYLNYMGNREFSQEDKDRIIKEIGEGQHQTELKKIQWAQNLAEHWWEMKARRASTDELVSKEETDSSGKKVTKPDFKDGSVRGGLYELRNLFKWQDVLRVRENAWHPKFHLLGMKKNNDDTLADKYDVIDLKIKDYDQEVISNLEKDTKEGKSGLTTEQLKEIVKDGKINYLARVNGKLFFSESYDYFKVNNESPMGYWFYSKIQSPAAAKDALAKNGEAYASKPTREKLEASFSSLGYLGPDQWRMQEDLLGNYLKWAAHERYQDTNRPNMTKFEIRNILMEDSNLAGDKEIEYIRIRQFNELEERVSRFRKASTEASELIAKIAAQTGRNEDEIARDMILKKLKRRSIRSIIGNFFTGFSFGILKKIIQEASKPPA